MRNYVFSATMSRELQRNLKKPKQKRRRLDDDEKGALGALGTLLDRMDFRDPDPALVDLLPEGGVVSTVKECCIDCLTSDKAGLILATEACAGLTTCDRMFSFITSS
jgi:ATP-dependent RNA helicase DDX24/MAK5